MNDRRLFSAVRRAAMLLAGVLTLACSDLGAGGGGVIIPTQALPSVRLKLAPSVAGDDSRLQEHGIEVTAAAAHVTDVVLPLPTRYACADYNAFLIEVTDGTPAECREDDAPQLHFVYPRIFDMLAGRSTPPSNDLLVPVGRYERLQVFFGAPASASATGEAAIGATAATAMRLAGRYATAATAFDFELRIAASALTSLTLYPAPTSAALDKRDVVEFVVELSLDGWLGPVAEEIARCLDASAAATVATTIVVAESPLPACADVTATLAGRVTAATEFAIVETGTTSAF